MTGLGRRVCPRCGQPTYREGEHWREGQRVHFCGIDICGVNDCGGMTHDEWAAEVLEAERLRREAEGGRRTRTTRSR